MRNPAAPGAVTESAELVLPLLPPQDLAVVASACRALRAAVTAVTARRAADAARGYIGRCRLADDERGLGQRERARV